MTTVSAQLRTVQRLERAVVRCRRVLTVLEFVDGMARKIDQGDDSCADTFTPLANDAIGAVIEAAAALIPMYRAPGDGASSARIEGAGGAA